MADLLPRGITTLVEGFLGTAPVVVLEGPRASGKTALGRILHASGLIASVVDLADPTVLAAAQASPSGLIEQITTPALIDEAQLVPDLLLPIKRRVDRNTAPGSFLLTGSSRLGRTQLGGSDPLAGRSVRARLWPMTQGELGGHPVDLVSRLITGDLPSGSFEAPSRDDLLGRISRGGLPTLAGLVAPVSDELRPALMAEYIEGVLAHEVGRRHDRAELVRLLRYLAASTARLLNVSTVSSELGAARDTVSARLATLEAGFLVHSLPAHRPGEHRTLTAHPKIHAGDTAIAAWATRLSLDPAAALYGALVETFVVNELAAQASWTPGRSLRHWRHTARKVEVDAVVVDQAGDVVPVEVKASRDVRPDDLAGLRQFLADVPSCERAVIFYTGELVLPVAERMWAVPMSALWSDTGSVPG